MAAHAPGTQSEPVARVLAKLERVRRSGVGWEARCPAHDDQHASLSISVGDDGRVLVRCHAGCHTALVVAALGIEMRDLFARPAAKGRTRSGPPGGVTLERYAEAKGLPIDVLKKMGLSDVYYVGQPAVRMVYRAPDGSEGPIRFRTALEKTAEGDDRFKWKSGSRPTLYGLDRLDRAREAGYVAVVEGESDCHTAWLHDIPALGVPGADNWKEERDAPHLDGIAAIYLVVEPDKGGATLAKALGASSVRDHLHLIDLGELKDVSGLYLADRAGFRAAWEAARARAVPWAARATMEANRARAAAWTGCRELAESPRILDRFAAEIAGTVAGEARNVQLLYLVVTSRLLERPISCAVKGPSSGGKSFTVESVLGFFPESAYYALSAMSERALAYSDEPLAHRMLVLYEAAGMAGDVASYLIRSLLSEGCVRYETVEKTSEGLQARLIERPGPTGLITTTTTLHLHPENETRMLSLSITDTPAQTADILVALAEEARAAVDVAPWHALQDWLAVADRRVAIPFATALAKMIPPVAVRLRRDFGALLNLIRAHALLHQARRGRDGHDRIVADLDDYAVVRGLVHDLVAEGIDATVAASTRETVAAVVAMAPSHADGVSVAQLAEALKLDRSAASRRMRTAVDRGFLRNLEEKKGRPARLKIGEPLPADREILPGVEALQATWNPCSDAGVREGIDTPPPPDPIDGGEGVPTPGNTTARLHGCAAWTPARALLETVLGLAEHLEWPSLTEPLDVGPGVASWDDWTDVASTIELTEALSQLDRLSGAL